MASRGRFLRPLLRSPAARALPRNLLQTAKLLAACHLVAEYVVSVKGTYGPSMLPTINVRDDWVFISKLHRRGKGVAVGDVVSIMHPMMPEVGAIKRVLGLPGDFVMRDSPEHGEGMMLQVRMSSSGLSHSTDPPRCPPATAGSSATTSTALATRACTARSRWP